MTKLSCRNYDHVSALWEKEGWIPSSAAQQAKAHYAGYSVNRGDGLRIIVLNTDICMSLHYLCEFYLPFIYRVYVRWFSNSRKPCLTMLISDNWFNYVNMTSIDPSGMLRFLTDELQDAEDAGDRGMPTNITLSLAQTLHEQCGSLVTSLLAGPAAML